ncbi:MAG TPA: hypothetical protein VK966_12825 [Longimicrobiales bacterium]|nr:hypothetical protein [Longimicrobiales bacterium]
MIARAFRPLALAVALVAAAGVSCYGTGESERATDTMADAGRSDIRLHILTPGATFNPVTGRVSTDPQTT